MTNYISMMRDIVTFCDKTLEIANCKKNLKSSMKKGKFNKIEKTIKECESCVTQFQEIQLTKVLSTKD